jgi:hypothetical protein
MKNCAPVLNSSIVATADNFTVNDQNGSDGDSPFRKTQFCFLNSSL